MYRALAWLSRAAAALAAAALFVTGLIVAYEVVMRYGFTAPTRWVEETAQILQVYAVFLAAAWLTLHRQHIRITILTDIVPAAVRRWLARLALLFIAATAGVAAFAAYDLMRFSIDMEQRTDSTLELPMWLLQLPVVAGLALVAVQSLARLIQSVHAPDVLAEDDGPPAV